MTTRAQFTSEEWERLVQLPRWVAAAASAAQHDLAYRTNIEVEAGFIASANGRESGNAFVMDVARETMAIYDDRSTVAAVAFTDLESGIADVLDRVRGVNAMLTAKADVADGSAYRRWLLTITDVVIAAARSGDFLGFGGRMVTENEHRFRDRLAAVLEQA